MKIDRSKLLEDLKKFSQADSGVVIGMPGAGKSYILRQLVIQWSDLKIPSCMLQLDALTDGSDEDIANFFGMPDKNWVKHLSELILPEGTKGLIVFDAFDSLRDDQLRNTILKQIATVKRDLPEWSIIVSVRTYDALKSQRLIDLFPLEYHEDEIHCRKFTVPYLTENELEEVLSSNKLLNSLFLSATARLKEIFRIPFFLSLLDVILKTAPKEVNALSLIKSEIELLDMYWSKVVYRIQPKLKTEKLLRKLTQQMISTRQLSVDKFEYLDKLENDEILIVDSLLSENVLAEQGIRLSKIAYAHNILFDYAVSRLILKESAQEIANFIQEDPSRCLFLRSKLYILFHQSLV